MSLPQTGSPASDFELKDHFGRRWRLSDHQGSVVLLLFYPANETLVCTKQLCSLRDNWAKYVDTGSEIVAITSTNQDDNARFAEKYRLPIPLLSDPGRKVTYSYASHPVLPLNLMRAITVIDGVGTVRTHQTMVRAFRPDDNDIVRALYAARSSVMELEQKELNIRIRRLLLGL